MVEGFKNTDAGIIPIDWVVKTGEELSERITKGASPRWQGFEYSDYGVLFVTSENVREGFLDVSVPKFLPQSFSEKQSNSCLKKGDLLINIVGASIGRACIYKLNSDANINQAVCLFRPNHQVNDNYLLHFLQSPQIIKKLVGSQVESARPNLSLTDIRKFQIPLPPTKAEQTAIATALSDVDELIQKLEQLLTKKRNIKTGAMQGLLKPKQGWELKRLGEIGECIIGLTYRPSNVKKDGTLVLRSSNIEGNKLVYGDNVYVNSEIPQRLKTQKGDILICVRNGSRNLIGKCAYINGRATGETFGAFMSIFRSAYNEYVFHVLQSDLIHRQIEETIGATINQLTNKNLNSFVIPFPNTDEQTRIAQILSDMDNEIQELEKQIDKYNKLKQGMMQSLLTGKIRLI